MMTDAAKIGGFFHALPYWLSLTLVPLVLLAAIWGGWALLLPVLGSWWLYGVLDAVIGRDTRNPDPDTPSGALFWHRLITMIWFPIQGLLILGLIILAAHTDHLAGWEKLGLFVGVGVVSGVVGIVYAHELIHQPTRLERWLGDLLLASVLYSHFRTEHLLVHHPHVGTPRDGVTARYNEGFHRYFLRVILTGHVSAWRAETARLARRDLSPWDGANPFWRYGALQLGALLLALMAGGWEGLGLFMLQALVAVWQLELTNYVEHYGLTRKHLGDGRYEKVQPHHSWNSDQRASNWLLINLQRHADHHVKPARRYPLLQTYPDSEAPLLPYGYPVMGIAALVPPLWRRAMNPRVRKWRAMYYPEITDWGPYKRMELPGPVAR